MVSLESRKVWEKQLGSGMEILLPHIFLTGLTLLLLFLPVPTDAIFGSEGDWYSQHVGAAEALRQTILSSGTIFPQFAGIGGGASAFDLAYYGYLRPDVLISCLLPNTDMRQIISFYGAAEVIAAVNLTYLWLKSKKLSTGFSLCGGQLMAAATCFFHAHHQIMFVNYMPFLVLALWGIDRILSGRKGLQLSMSVFLICIHSFYYAPACLVVCLLYGLSQLGRGAADVGWERLPETKFRTAVRAGAAALLGVGLAAVLLLPTAVDILSTSKDAGAFMDKPFPAVSLTFKSLLYYPYGCGMTMLALYCLLLSLTGKGKRALSAAALLFLTVPAVWWVLSGFLYPREKILIPLVPVLVWICADTLQAIYREEQRPYVLPALLCFIPAFLSAESRWQSLMYVDAGLILAWVLALKLRESPLAVKKTMIAVLLLLPLCTSLGINGIGEDYLAADDERQSRFSFGDITVFAEDIRYRFDYLANNYINSNVLPDGSLNKTASYLSVTNSLYGDFYYNTMGNPISLRNRVVLMPNQNSLFNYFMGVRYVLTEENRIPYGYEKVFSRNGYVLAENPDVLPICYGVRRIVSEEKLAQLDFPYNAAALCGIKVKKEVPEEFFKGEFPVSFDTAVSSAVDNNVEKFLEGEGDKAPAEPGSCMVPLAKKSENRVLFICFDVNRRDGKEVCITINGMKNNLSGNNAPYPNENYHFTYVLSAEKGIEQLNMEFTKGDYEIENLQVYTGDMPSGDSAEITLPTLDEDFRSNGKSVFKGKIEMEEDGWFVTSYPWKEGYRVTVDGQTVEAEKVNTAFTGFQIKKGTHAVEIQYEAPGFKEGLIVSGVSLAGLLLSAAALLRERKREK